MTHKAKKWCRRHKKAVLVGSICTGLALLALIACCIRRRRRRRRQAAARAEGVVGDSKTVPFLLCCRSKQYQNLSEKDLELSKGPQDVAMGEVVVGQEITQI